MTMRRAAAILAGCAAAVTSASAVATEPAAAVLERAPLPTGTVTFVETIEFLPVLQNQRAVQCPADFFSCEDRGSAFNGVCCRTGQLCALDSNNQAACCPTGNICTGVAPSSTGVPVPSYVNNQYFPFPYVATSFSNSGACSAAVSQCGANYQACTAQLMGVSNGYGVTIVVPGGGGTTVAPTQPAVGSATATSVCSSLSQQACHSLQSSQCAITGSANGFYVGTANAAPRPTAACMVGVMAGVGLGVFGGNF